MGGPAVGSTHYFSAYGVVRRGYPLVHSGEDPPEVLDLMHRVTLIPSHSQPLFAPRVTVVLRDGRTFTRQGTGREFIWDFPTEAARIREIVPALAMSPTQYEALIDACGRLDALGRVADLVELTLARA
jgi:hypothetical protein